MKTYRKILHLFDLPESAVDPLLRKLSAKYPEIDFSIYPTLGTLTVHCTTEAEKQEEAMNKLEEPFSEIEGTFATHCFHSETGAIEEAVHHTFRENHWTLSIAESCTGGTAAARLTRLSGASEYFLGGVVPYADEVKIKVLEVPEKLIAKVGAVSKEVVEKMAEGIIRLTGSDFALSVSGIAGPTGGSIEKPVGLIWCAVCRRGEMPRSWHLQVRGTREMIITRSVNSLFSNLLIYTKETSLL